MRNRLAGLIAFAAIAFTGVFAMAEDADPYIWLEDIHGAKPLAWVAEQNARTRSVLQADPRYQPAHDAILKVLDATDRIPYGTVNHGQVFNFWQDAANPKGIWRTTTAADYATPDPHWQTILDVDKLAKDEKENWIWKGASCTPDLKRCLLFLSRDGGDAHVIREFDMATKSFVKDGFELPHAKSDANYLDDDTIAFDTDFGPGTLTKSSYPRIVKLWHRGEKIADAKTLLEGTVDDISVQTQVAQDGDTTYGFLLRGVNFFESEYYSVDPSGETHKLPLPLGVTLQGVHAGRLLFTLRKDWTVGAKTFAKGSLVAVTATSLATPDKLDVVALYTPDARSSIDGVATARDAVYASVYENVTGRILAFHFKDGAWTSTKLDLPANGSTAIVGADDCGPDAFVTYESYLQPPTLYRVAGDAAPAAIKSLPARFDASGLVTEQFEAKSADGTMIPYFVTRPKVLNGPAPTVLYGYGGFEISLTPGYSANFGKLWLTQGGIYVVANIRGGGEFGPAWHEAALFANRIKAYDDFAAVAQDLVKRGLTTTKQLGIVGGSNGGLLVSASMVLHPDLFGAVVCQVPLIDMIRYTQIGAGQSWADEYGDPKDPKARAWILKYSPYQNVKKGVKYPPILFTTATSDDRVTPVHARKMAARMESFGDDVLFFENTDGGHSAGANHAQAAEMWALTFTYLAQRLGLK
ncbi:MAG: S9 family peptidase [Proteobacteria bacterium]|nr:S9 family peptidase [Pseudomonadota bacterium]